MAWSDKPTDAQIERLFQWLKWQMTDEQARDAVHWLRDNATRKDVSDEMDRIHELKEKRLLDYNKCFDSQIWDKYEKEDE